MSKWSYNGDPLEEIPESAFGFIYKIIFEDSTFYIGQKTFYSTRRVKVAGRTNRKIIKKESNWKTYASSSKVVQDKIKQGVKCEKIIMYFCANKSCLNYHEAYEMFKEAVLCNPRALNKNILLKLFHCSETMTITGN